MQYSISKEFYEKPFLWVEGLFTLLIFITRGEQLVSPPGAHLFDAARFPGNVSSIGGLGHGFFPNDR